MARCPDCGAVYLAPGDGCAARFNALLALDHSRREPWGSRHGLAVSAFALQHPGRYGRDVLERAWLYLFSVYVTGRDRGRVARALRRAGKAAPGWAVPPLPAARPEPRFGVTIADLGSFAAETYASQLDSWCQAALAAWRVPPGRSPAP